MQRKNASGEAKARFWQRRDLIIILILLLLASIWALFLRQHEAQSSGRLYAVIQLKNQELDRIPMVPGQARDFVYDAHPGVRFHRYEDGSLAFVESDCPDKLCIHMGKVRRPGQFAACLPNEMLLTVVAEKAEATLPEVDIVR